MNIESYKFGCRSAIRVAVRRGDIQLARSAFDIAWVSLEHRNWFKFRLPLIVVEEAFYLIGVYSAFLDNVDNLGEEESYRKFLYILTLSTKSKDIGALAKLCVSKHGPTEWKHRELSLCRKLWALACEEGVEKASLDILTYEGTSTTRYTAQALGVLYEQIMKGGNQWNRKTLLLGMFIIAVRGLDKEVIQKEVKRVYKLIPKKIKVVKLPWYSVTPCSLIGTEVISNIVRKNNITKDMLKKLWFYNEFEYMNPGMILNKRLSSRKNTAFDSMWWEYERKKYKGYIKRWEAFEEKIQKQIKLIFRKLKI